MPHRTYVIALASKSPFFVVAPGKHSILIVVSLGRGAKSILYRLNGTDSGAIAITSGVLASVSLLAGYIPARRASMVDPVQAIRTD